jgi:hypothetical protein
VFFNFEKKEKNCFSIKNYYIFMRGKIKTALKITAPK